MEAQPLQSPPDCQCEDLTNLSAYRDDPEVVHMDVHSDRPVIDGAAAIKTLRVVEQQNSPMRELRGRVHHRRFVDLHKEKDRVSVTHR